MSTTLTEKHIRDAFEMLALQGFEPPSVLVHQEADEHGRCAASEGRKAYHRQLRELSMEELRGAVMAWARRSTGGYPPRWPTPGDLLEQARVLRAATAGASIQPESEFLRLLSAAQAARSGAKGPSGAVLLDAQDRAWCRLLSQRYGTAPDAEGRPRIQMPAALRAALMNVGGLRGLLAITDAFHQGQVLKAFCAAYAKAAEVMPAPRRLELREPPKPRLLPDVTIEEPDALDGMALNERGRPEHHEVVWRDQRELAAFREGRGGSRRVAVRGGLRGVADDAGRGGPSRRLGDVIQLPPSGRWP